MNMNTLTQELNKKVKKMDDVALLKYLNDIVKVWRKSHSNSTRGRYELQLTWVLVEKEEEE